MTATVVHDVAYGATIAKRRLAINLTMLRQDRGLTATQVCRRLGWGRGKLGRFETNQWKRPEMSDIRDLLRLYGVEGSEQDRIIELAVLARRRPWWREYGDVFGSEYPGFENDARAIGLFLPLAVPPLFQTRAYAETHAGRMSRSARWRDRLVETIAGRQRILLRDGCHAPMVTAVITEAALLYDWGDRAARREQAAHLAMLGARPNIEIRLYPFEAGPHPGPLGPVCHLRFGPGDADLIFLDTGINAALVTDPDQAETHAEHLSQAVAGACAPTETLARLSHLAETLH